MAIDRSSLRARDWALYALLTLTLLSAGLSLAHHIWANRPLPDKSLAIVFVLVAIVFQTLRGRQRAASPRLRVVTSTMIALSFAAAVFVLFKK